MTDFSTNAMKGGAMSLAGVHRVVAQAHQRPSPPPRSDRVHCLCPARLKAAVFVTLGRAKL